MIFWKICRVRVEEGLLGWVDRTGLLSTRYRLDAESVLNGIAYYSKAKRLFVTGKRWPKLFEIQIVAAAR